jgi:hypothetical protein
MSAVNGHFKDHGLEPVTLFDIVAKVKKRLAASQVAIEDTPLRVHLPDSIVAKALRMAQALRLQLTDGSTRAALQATLARDHVRLLHALLLWYYSTYSSVAGALASTAY